MLSDLKKKPIDIICFSMGLCLLVFIYYLKISEIVVRADFQWEVREGVGLYIAQRFAEGINPYVFHEGNPEAVYMYGFLLPALLSVFIKLGVSDVVLTAQLITIVVEIIGVALFGILLKRSNVRLKLIPIGMIGMSSCYFRVSAYGGVFPDVYGLTLLIIIWMVVQRDEKRAKYSVLMYAILCTVGFYFKQYFVMASLGFIVFFVIKKQYRDLLKFIIVGSSIGVISLLLVRIIFPTYFTTNTFFLGVYNAYSFSTSLEQIRELLFIFWCFFALLFVGFVINIIFGKFEKIKDNMYALAQAITMLGVGLLLSTSNGAWYTYYLQLWIPYMVFLAMLFWSDISDRIINVLSKNIILVWNVVEVVLLVLVFYSHRGLCLQERMSAQEIAEWNNIYEVLDEYKGEKYKISALPLTFYCIKNNIYSDNTGHTNCYTYELLDMVRKNEPSNLLYPEAKRLTEQYMDYNAESIQKCRDGYYDCVVLEKYNYYVNEVEDALGDKYDKLKDYSLKCGAEKWECSVYVKKGDNRFKGL